MSIEHVRPLQPKPAITHTTLIGFSLSGIAPAGWTLPATEIRRIPFLRVDLLDAVRTAPGVFEGQGVREVFYSGETVRAFFTAEAVRLRGLRRAVEDFLVARGTVSGAAITD